MPDEDGHFLINPFGLTFDEIAAFSLLKVDADGGPVFHYLSVRSLLILSRRAVWRRAREIEELVRQRRIASGLPTCGLGNTTGLVGTPERVADAMLDYYRLGVDHFLIRGFDSLGDAAEYGRQLLPVVRKKIAFERNGP